MGWGVSGTLLVVLTAGAERDEGASSHCQFFQEDEVSGGTQEATHVRAWVCSWLQGSGEGHLTGERQVLTLPAPALPPRNGYQKFSQELLSNGELNHLPLKERMVEIGSRWQRISQSQKEHYKKLAEEQQKQYKVHLDLWVKVRGKEWQVPLAGTPAVLWGSTSLTGLKLEKQVPRRELVCPACFCPAVGPSEPLLACTRLPASELPPRALVEQSHA